MTHQLSMFQTEDLPLFSGTAPRGKVEPFKAKPEPKQERLPASCDACADTGVLGEYAFCWCEAGQERKKLRAETGPLPVNYVKGE